MSRARPARPPLFTVRTLLILMFSLMVGLGVGWLTFVNQAHAAAAVLAGGAAFGACVVGLHQLVE